MTTTEPKPSEFERITTRIAPWAAALVAGVMLWSDMKHAAADLEKRAQLIESRLDRAEGIQSKTIMDIADIKSDIRVIRTLMESEARGIVLPPPAKKP